MFWQSLTAATELRAVPEIILGGHFFFSDPSIPRTHMESEPPRPPGHVSALINLPHYGSNTPWPPGQVTSPPPTPQTHCQQNTLHPQDINVFVPPPRIISGTALTCSTSRCNHCIFSQCLVSHGFHFASVRTWNDDVVWGPLLMRVRAGWF